MEWLRDPIWQFVGAIIGIMAIVLTYFVFKRQQKIKSIVYEIISNTPLLSVKSEIKNKMQVFYGQRAIENLDLLILKIQNAGNEPVLPTDFEKPIIVEFDENAEILEVECVEVSPENLQPSIEKNKSKISLLPILLNEKDYITLKVLLTNFNGKTTVTGRIAGIKQVLGVGIDRLSSPPSFLGNIIVASLFSTFVIMFIIGALVSFITSQYVIIGVILLAASIIYIRLVIVIILDINNKVNELFKK